MHGYLAVAVCLFGIISNLLNIVVLTRKHMRSPTNFILTALAIADILTMSPYVVMATYFYIIYRPLCEEGDRHTKPWMYFILFHNLYIVTCHMMAMWLTVSLAVFRYIFVCRHQVASTMCTMQRARLTVVIVVIGSIVSCIPNCFIYKVRDANSNDTLLLMGVQPENLPGPGERDSCYYVYPSDFAIGHPEYVTFVRWLYGVVIKILPCIVLAYLSMLLIIAMQRAKKRRARLLNNISRVIDHDSSSEHNRTTKMLVAVVLCFVITELPQGVTAWISAVDEDFFEKVYVQLGDFMDILVLINSAVNFILYCIMSQQFRDTFKSLFVAKHLPSFLQRVKHHSNGGGASAAGGDYSMVHTETTHV
ncbi:FMRFamide receptor [Elysia marginata]|uniref:FMRFamide receptor n=1 Tax=Elysia marginata TaxID=1093978 RepID=A0AAV4G1R2_9GAST|nr:FMRFamide receptor [Elysia marginata]